MVSPLCAHAFKTASCLVGVNLSSSFVSLSTVRLSFFILLQIYEVYCTNVLSVTCVLLLFPRQKGTVGGETWHKYVSINLNLTSVTI